MGFEQALLATGKDMATSSRVGWVFLSSQIRFQQLSLRRDLSALNVTGQIHQQHPPSQSGVVRSYAENRHCCLLVDTYRFVRRPKLQTEKRGQ